MRDCVRSKSALFPYQDVPDIQDTLDDKPRGKMADGRWQVADDGRSGVLRQGARRGDEARPKESKVRVQGKVLRRCLAGTSALFGGLVGW